MPHPQNYTFTTLAQALIDLDNAAYGFDADSALVRTTLINKAISTYLSTSGSSEIQTIRIPIPTGGQTLEGLWQAAINGITDNALTKQYEIILPPGAYNIAGNINLKPYIHTKGYGDKTTRTQLIGTGAQSFLLSMPVVDGTYFYQMSDIYILNINPLNLDWSADSNKELYFIFKNVTALCPLTVIGADFGSGTSKSIVGYFYDSDIRISSGLVALRDVEGYFFNTSLVSLYFRDGIGHFLGSIIRNVRSNVASIYGFYYFDGCEYVDTSLVHPLVTLAGSGTEKIYDNKKVFETIPMPYSDNFFVSRVNATTAALAAIPGALAPSATKQYFLEFPSGTFNLTADIILRPYINFIGKSSALIQRTAFNTTAPSVFKMVGTNITGNIRIQGIHFLGNCGITVTNAAGFNIILELCDVAQAATSAIVLTGDIVTPSKTIGLLITASNIGGAASQVWREVDLHALNSVFAGGASLTLRDVTVDIKSSAIGFITGHALTAAGRTSYQFAGNMYVADGLGYPSVFSIPLSANEPIAVFDVLQGTAAIGAHPNNANILINFGTGVIYTDSVAPASSVSAMSIVGGVKAWKAL